MSQMILLSGMGMSILNALRMLAVAVASNVSSRESSAKSAVDEFAFGGV